MIWVTGCNGMLGSAVCAALEADSLPYAATDVEVDITLPEAVADCGKTLSRGDWIVNCAAYTAVDKAEEEPERCHAINVEGPRTLAAFAASKQLSLLHISTDYVFDGNASEPYAESAPVNPQSVYGHSKADGEAAVRNELAEHVIIRTAWLYGPNGKNFISTILRLAEEREELRVVDDQWGSPTYAADLSQAVARVVRSKTPVYGTFHFVNQGKTSWYGLALRTLERAHDSGFISKLPHLVPVPTTEYPTAAKRPSNSVLSSARFQETYGLSARPWEAALEEYLQMISSKRAPV